MFMERSSDTMLIYDKFKCSKETMCSKSYSSTESDKLPNATCLPLISVIPAHIPLVVLISSNIAIGFVIILFPR